MNKIEARQKIKEHIIAREDEGELIITEPLVLHWWRVMNVAVFDDLLPLPSNIKIINFRRDIYGECKGKRNKEYDLYLHKKYDSRKTFLTVLVHEMVHAHEWVTHDDMCHGINFFGFEERIMKRTGLPLARKID